MIKAISTYRNCAQRCPVGLTSAQGAPQIVRQYYTIDKLCTEAYGRVMEERQATTTVSARAGSNPPEALLGGSKRHVAQQAR